MGVTSFFDNVLFYTFFSINFVSNGLTEIGQRKDTNIPRLIFELVTLRFLFHWIELPTLITENQKKHWHKNWCPWNLGVLSSNLSSSLQPFHILNCNVELVKIRGPSKHFSQPTFREDKLESSNRKEHVSDTASNHILNKFLATDHSHWEQTCWSSITSYMTWWLEKLPLVHGHKVWVNHSRSSSFIVC